MAVQTSALRTQKQFALRRAQFALHFCDQNAVVTVCNALCNAMHSCNALSPHKCIMNHKTALFQCTPECELRYAQCTFECKLRCAQCILHYEFLRPVHFSKTNCIIPNALFNVSCIMPNALCIVNFCLNFFLLQFFCRIFWLEFLLQKFLCKYFLRIFFSEVSLQIFSSKVFFF